MPESSQYAQSVHSQASNPGKIIANSTNTAPQNVIDVSRHKQIERAAYAVLDFCRPLSDFLNRGALGSEARLPVLDVTVLALDALTYIKDADQKQHQWRIVTGRVTRGESAESLYSKGVWLESDDGYILDFNRPGLAGGIRVTHTDTGITAEYRTDKLLKSPKTSSLLPVWRGDAVGFEEFASQLTMRNSFCALKHNVNLIMTSKIAYNHI